jgi:hypothetical protein
MASRYVRITSIVALAPLALVSVPMMEACGGTVSQSDDGSDAAADRSTTPPCNPGDVGPANASCGDCANGIPQVVNEICVNGVFVCPPNNMACPMKPGPCDGLQKPTCNAGACLLTPVCDGTMWQCPMAPSFCFADAGPDAGDAGAGDAGSDGSRDASAE